MGKLIYSAIASADGYIEDADGSFDWAAPDEELHRFVNDLERRVGTYLYGRRMYQTMRYWETAHTIPDQLPHSRDYAAIWQAADKIVFSTTLASAPSPRTRLEHDFEPGQIRQLKQASGQDISIGGAHLAGQAIRAGLVDEIQLVIVPVLVGGGKPALPADVRSDLELLSTRRFASGAVYLAYSLAL